MAVSVMTKSASISITHRPHVNTPAVSGALMTFNCSQLTVAGECKITGGATDSPAGWTLGWIQLQWIETNWGYYRGHTNNDGSCFLQRARPPARPAQACRDTLTVGAIFVDNNPGLDKMVATAGMPFPVKLTASFPDAPSDAFPLSRNNSLTGKMNYLREAQLEFHFCSVLSLRDPGGTFHHLKHFLWNVHWQGKFLPTNFSNLAAPWTITHKTSGIGNSAHVSPIYDGGPTDRRFRSIITTASTANCNSTAGHALAAPNTNESKTWKNFDVRR